jgi:hypothetical protein
MRILLSAAAALMFLGACGEGGSCPNPPKCTSGKLCGCSCISASKKCTKLVEDASLLVSEGEMSEADFNALMATEE